MSKQRTKRLPVSHFYDYYKDNSHSESRRTKVEFNQFMDGCFRQIANKLLEGEDFIIPFSLGVLGIRLKEQRLTTIKDDMGKPIQVRGLSIDWGATIKWYMENEAACKDMTYKETMSYIGTLPKGQKNIIKKFNDHTDSRVAILQYIKEYPGARSKYKGKKFKSFKAGKFFRWNLRDVMNEGKVDFPMYDTTIR